MGCLNSGKGYTHWFGNIHLSGPCNRACYFCIGQHMMALDGENVLDTWPLPGLDEFLIKCGTHFIDEVFVTGTNTDPLLYKHLGGLTDELRTKGFTCGIRTNGIGPLGGLKCFDKGSVTICSTNRDINTQMMGGPPANIRLALELLPDLKVNIVLGPENKANVPLTLAALRKAGVTRVNLREPYGQPHVGDPLEGTTLRGGEVHGMPSYDWGGMEVVYWDVHFVEVESVNLYANGRVSVDYPITRGCADGGVVLPQEEFAHGRHREQWI